MGGIEDIRVTGLRHMDSIYDINPDELKKQRMSRVIDDSARHHYRYIIYVKYTPPRINGRATNFGVKTGRARILYKGGNI